MSSKEAKREIESRLKTCPFCGGRPYMEMSHRAFIGGKTTKVAFVRCSECNARTGRFELEYGNSSDARLKAEDAWNKRVKNGEFTGRYL